MMAEQMWKVEFRQTWDGDQNRNHLALIDVVDGHKVQIKIKRDSYEFQSSAIAQVWSGTQWKTVATTPYPRMVTVAIASHYKDITDKLFEAEINTLMYKVLWILGKR